MTEERLQYECFTWFWNNCPQYRGLLFHIPNGGARNKIEASKFRAIGVVSGIPDLCFLFKGKCYFFELKTELGRLSDNQKTIIAQFKTQNIDVFLIRNFDEFKKQILEIITWKQQ